MMDYYPLNLIFTQKDLYWLDQLMPGKKKTDDPIPNGFGGCRRRKRKNDEYVVNGKNEGSKNNGGNYEKNLVESGNRAAFCQSMLSTGNNDDKAAPTLQPLLDNGVNNK